MTDEILNEPAAETEQTPATLYPSTDEEMIVPKIGKVVDIATKLNDLVERNKIDYASPEFHTGMQSDQLKEAGSILEYVLRDLLVAEKATLGYE